MFDLFSNKEEGKPFSIAPIGEHRVRPIIDLNTFELLMAGRVYDHAKDQGLCYVWCIFKIVELLTSFDMHLQLISLFKNIKQARESVRLIDGYCLNADNLANALCLDKYKVKGWGNFTALDKVDNYIKTKVSGINYYVLGYTGTHWVLINPHGVLYDSIIRGPEYIYTFKYFQVFKYTITRKQVKML